MKKSVFLILTLAIPVSIFLFLKFFGTNTFEVPFLFEEGIPDCPNSTGPHIVPEFEYIGETEKNLNSDQLEGFLVFVFFDVAKPERNKALIVELVRIQDAFYEVGAPYFVLFINEIPKKTGELRSLIREMGLEQKNSSLAYMEHEQLSDFLKCGIALINNEKDPITNLALVDPERRIRGIYDGLEVEQTDQLILELKILKKKM